MPDTDHNLLIPCILEAVAESFGVDIYALKSQKRSSNTYAARCAAMWIINTRVPEIEPFALASHFSVCTRETVIRCLNSARERIDSDGQFRSFMEAADKRTDALLKKAGAA